MVMGVTDLFEYVYIKNLSRGMCTGYLNNFPIYLLKRFVVDNKNKIIRKLSSLPERVMNL